MLCPVVPRGPSEGGRQAKGTAGGADGPHECNHASSGTCDACSGSNSDALRRTHSAAYRAGGDRSRLLRELAGKLLACAVSTAVAARFGSAVPLALHLALSYGMLALMGGIMDTMALYCTAVWGLDLVPPFHDPFRATSLADVTQGGSHAGLAAGEATGVATSDPDLKDAARPIAIVGQLAGLNEMPELPATPRGEVPDAGWAALKPCRRGGGNSGGTGRRAHGGGDSDGGGGGRAMAATVKCCAMVMGRPAAGCARKLALMGRAWWRNVRFRRAAALLVVFVFSGIEHEIFHWYIQRFVSWSWLTFFSVHGVLLVAEGAVRRAARCAAAADGRAGGGTAGVFPRAAECLVHMPTWLARLLTLAVLEATAYLWFFDVLLEPGVVGRVVRSVRSMVAEMLLRT
ncbi:hypothetical protein GPECTOR_7g1125 [Gonium pectorale]|uniref:Wax synthase domain-containing protein n=1 Tax=Gonium pectorale TaxID=33097 RepID=A0A150GTT1_GONPE|nr:hypothetical protein GPECTOR_7g1125 [Gonium pectorale]|eukprot:KXZ53231.1 hypothetical protein GPECTOR_7g1125 [Gonium pectorale]